mmetsp:Transcript_489/g.1225  ORF Transcript_489/g.1225 Transcript_489/m.1225 type:complete len:576 (-) Transcript_489:259-1986(-)
MKESFVEAATTSSATGGLVPSFGNSHQPQPHQHQHQRLYSFWAIVVIAANTMNGPGLTTLPEIAFEAGQFMFCTLVIVGTVSTSFVLQKLCDVMWRTQKGHGEQTMHENHRRGVGVGGGRDSDNHPSNSHTNRSADSHNIGRPSLEETDIVALSNELYDQKKLASLIMIGCALSLALAQMMLCAAISDSMIVAVTGQSCGYGPTTFQTHCTSNLSMKPFLSSSSYDSIDESSGSGSTDSSSAPISLISMGIMVSSSITVSLAAVDLDSMLTAQYLLFGCLLLACCRFCYTLHNMSLPITSTKQYLDNDLAMVSEAPFWVGPQPFDAVGPVLFNFAFVVTAPPLSCGATSRSMATKALVVSCIIMGTLYSIVGYIGATAATNTPRDVDDNLLSLVLRGSDPDVLEPLDMWSVVLFGLSQLAAIPVYCELARETLLTHIHMKNRQLAFCLSHVLPWTVVALTYNSELFEAFVEWSSLLLLGFSNFSLPLLLHHKHTLVDEQIHHRLPRPGPDIVVWGLAVITASISAVIVQRITKSTILAEFVFLGSCTGVIYNLEWKNDHRERSTTVQSSPAIQLT